MDNSNRRKMMMKMYKTITITLVVLMTTGCSNSMIQLDEKKQVLISNDKSQIIVTSKNIKKSSINLSSIYVDQYILSSKEGSCLVYEDVKTADGYFFTFNDKQTIRRIFDAADVQNDGSFGKITFYRLVLRDKRRSRLNVLVLMDSMSSIKLFYGFDDSVYKMFKQGMEGSDNVLEYVVGSDDKHISCLKNRWPESLVIVDSLVSLDD